MQEALKQRLQKTRLTWLVTGAAGFIGSHLVEALLSCGQDVIGLDNFSMGKRENLDEVLHSVSQIQRGSFRLIKGDICDLQTCYQACRGVDVILHQAAISSVPQCEADPLKAFQVNTAGFANLLQAAVSQLVGRVVYASSSAVYGHAVQLPLHEEAVIQPKSHYAFTKVANEFYADACGRLGRLQVVGLRYFNVFGPRQDAGAVIPGWIDAMIDGKPAVIHGDGQTTRDFCPVANVVQANLLAAVSDNPDVIGHVFNVGCGERTSLLELFETMRLKLLPRYHHLRDFKPQFEPARAGDISRSQADISKAKQVLGYQPEELLADGLNKAIQWHMKGTKE